MPRRAGLGSRVAYDANIEKSTHTLAKYRTGYRKMWEIKRVRRYMKQIGLKEPGTYDPNNQQGGDMFALPREVKMTNKQAGRLFQLCKESGKCTKSNLRDVMRTLSFAYQLVKQDDGNWKLVKYIWSKTNPDGPKVKPPTQKTKPVVTPEPDTLKMAYTKEYTRDCGMDYMQWNVGLLLTHDLNVFGCRQDEDIKRIKKSKSHTCAPSNGWMATDYVGGRAKLESNKGVRPWKLYRVCFCPNAKHQRIPKDWDKYLDKDGNPEGNLPWCTTCPLNAFEMVRNYLPGRDMRTYPKWWTSKHGNKRFHKTWNINEKDHQKCTQQWLDAQGANPDGVVFDSNGGRKSLGKWCAEFGVPYDESFEIHGDLWKTWRRNYQKKLRSKPDFDRRTQHPDVDVCTRALWRFARGIGRGHSTRDDPDTLSEEQKARALMAIMRHMKMNQELANIVDPSN